MTLFIDNDIIHKLAACDLLESGIATLKSDASAVRILSTFKHRFGLTNENRRAKMEKQLGVPTFGRILTFQETVAEIDAVSPTRLALFEDYPAIDAGEAMLFIAASENPESFVITGDKRSLRCLASAERCQEIIQSLSGRVICFEQLIAYIISQQGFDKSKSKIVPAIDCDTALRAAFGMGLDAEEKQVLRVLNSYVQELRNATRKMLREDHPS